MNHYLIRYAQSGSADQREQLRGTHIAYRKALGSALALAGPLLSETGEPVGSTIIVAATDAAEADRIATGDPYVLAGLLRLTSIERLRIAAMVPPTAN